MAKTRVSKGALEDLVLAEIRCEEGCGQIVSVEIEYAPCRTVGNFGNERIIVRPPGETMALASDKYVHFLLDISGRPAALPCIFHSVSSA
jgi:hypothetical protein